MKSISPIELREQLEVNQSSIQLIDIREDWETDICKIEGAVHFPMSHLEEFITQIDTQKKVVIQCHHGIRSERVVHYLEDELKMENIYNLDGGISEWIHTVDNTLTDY